MTLRVKENGVFTPVGGSGGGTADEWVRPADWVTLPTVNSGEQKVIGLVAVYEGDSNFVGVQCAGNYTVDWGDGSAAVNATASAITTRNITWASVPSNTLTSGGYRQAVVTITPQAGQTLTSVTVNPTLISVGVSSAATTPWLDIKLAGANITDLSTSATARSPRLLQQFEYVGPSALTSVGSVFTNASALRNVVGTQWTATVTNFTGMFSGCSSLQSIPLLNTAAGTNFTNMFSTCSGLQTIPLINTAAGLTFSTMFNTCSSLSAIPLLNTAAGTNLTGMFTNCQNLQVGAMAGTKVTITYASCKLSATQLDAIYSNLASGVAGQTITVTGNHGVAGDTPAIATAKGWTVTG